MIANKKDVFPLPIGPIRETVSPLFIVKSIFYNIGVLCSKSSVYQ